MKRIIGMAFAMLAVGAALTLPAGASASAGFAADEYPATVKGVTQLELVTKWGNLSCNRHLNGTLTGPAASLSLGASGGTGCELNGCELTLKPGSSSFDIGPPGCGPVRFASACGWVGVSPQVGLAASYNGNSVTLAGVGATATLLGTGPCGPKGSQSSAQVKGSVSLSAVDGGGSAVGVSSYAENVPNGIHLSSGNPSSLQAQAFPVRAEASPTPGGTVTVFDHPTVAVDGTCSGAAFLTGILASPATQFGLNGGVTGCESNIGKATVLTNTCGFAISNLENGTQGDADLTCATPGDKIEFKATLCVVKIPAQSLGVVQLQNQGTDTNATIDLELESNAVAYTSSGIGCAIAGLPASGSNGQMAMDLTLAGTWEG